MKTLAGLLLTTILLIGCNDSSTEPTTGNDDINSSDPGQTSGGDSGSSTDDTSDSSGSDADTDNDIGGEMDSSGGPTDSASGYDTDDASDGSGSNTDTDDNSSGETDTGDGISEPEPSTVKFTGEDFNYQLIHPGYYGNERNEFTIDSREGYTVRATSYLEAHSLLEAMHAINAYRNDAEQIKYVNGGIKNLDSLISDYCPTSGERFAPARCAFYARLAYNKTKAQDGWQIEHRQNYDVPLMCTGVALKFMDCRYSVMGFSRAGGSGYDGPNTGEVRTTAASPIEAWQYEKNQTKITAINRAFTSYLRCTTSDDDFHSQYLYALPTLSPWPVADPTWTTMRATQYGTLIVWLLSDDTVEDVYRDVIAEHHGSDLCNAAFQLDLKDVQPNASF